MVGKSSCRDEATMRANITEAAKEDPHYWIGRMTDQLSTARLSGGLDPHEYRRMVDTLVRIRETVDASKRL